jgi:hypothetical protein
VANHREVNANQSAAADTLTTETKQHSGSDAPLEGGATLDLYLAELGSNVVAITEQSALLLLQGPGRTRCAVAGNAGDGRARN